MIFNHLRRMAKQVVERLLIIAAFTIIPSVLSCKCINDHRIPLRSDKVGHNQCLYAGRKSKIDVEVDARACGRGR
jgi:hypothetical protein